MSNHRSQIVKRVMHALDETQDPEELVWAYFDADREAVIEATRQTLAATRDDTSQAKVAETVDRELLELLRFPVSRSGGLMPWLIMHRVGATWTGVLIALATSLAMLVL
jgi:aromatic ring-cleaving dioxygenase